MAAVSGTSGRGDEVSGIVQVVDGLVERLQRSPLMRRAPAQCSPEEQTMQGQLLADLASLRQLRSGVAALPPLRHELVVMYWPELADVLAPPRRAVSGAARKGPREITADMDTPSLFDAHGAPELGEPNVAAVESAVPAPAPAEAAGADLDLAHLLTEALSETGRALNTTQMLAWLEARGVKVARERVTDTLFRHEDRFRRRGASQWTTVGQDLTATSV